MDRFVLVVFLSSISFLCLSQTRHPLHLTIHEGSNWTIKIDTISKELFNKAKVFRYQEHHINKDSLLRSKLKEFPDRIVLADSCLILKAVDKDIRLCRRAPNDEKAWTGFEAYGFTNGYFTVMESGWESWAYISFNPTTRKYFYTSNEPIFLRQGLAYAYGNYYAEGQFQIVDVDKDRHFGFETFNWELTAFYQEGTKFFIEFTPKWGPRHPVYLRLDYK